MGFWARLRTIFGAKANKALDRLEDPRETLDYSYERQVKLLADVRRGLADVATSKQRLKLQAEKLQQQEAHHQSQAQQALMQGKEDLARLALQRRAALAPQITALNQQVVQLDEQQTKLQAASQQLETRIQMFRSQKEAIKAQYTASSAQVKITESFTGLSTEMNNIGLTVQRAQDRIETMQARSSALDELINSGALQDVTALPGAGDDIDRQLALSPGSPDIDAELAALKAQLNPPQEPPKLEAPKASDPHEA